MKINFIFFVFLFCLTICSHNVKTENHQPNIIPQHELMTPHASPFIPIEFTATGLSNFFENIYNKYGYGQEFLPNNFSHMIQFLEYGKNTKQKGAYLKSVVKLFGNKLKSASYVNSYAFIDLLEIFPTLTKHYFVIPTTSILEQNKKIINNILYKNFLSRFTVFKQDPKAFFNDISENVLKTLNKQSNMTDKHVNVEHLKQAVIRFLELGIGKLIWSPQEHENIWELFYSTAKHIETFATSNIVNDLDDMDDLFWSLIHRFCFFIELAGQQLPVEFYTNFRTKLASSDLLMFNIKEQEKSIKTKELHLVHTLFEGEAKSRAYKNGIIL